MTTSKADYVTIVENTTVSLINMPTEKLHIELFASRSLLSLKKNGLVKVNSLPAYLY